MRCYGFAGGLPGVNRVTNESFIASAIPLVIADPALWTWPMTLRGPLVTGP